MTKLAQNNKLSFLKILRKGEQKRTLNLKLIFGKSEVMGTENDMPKTYGFDMYFLFQREGRLI